MSESKLRELEGEIFYIKHKILDMRKDRTGDLWLIGIAMLMNAFTLISYQNDWFKEKPICESKLEEAARGELQ